MYHEGKVCDAVIRYLEAHRGVKRDRCWSPENETHRYPIDLVCQMDDGSHWAFEHTSIQAFEDEIKLNIDMAEFKKPIIKALSTILPHSEQIILYVPIQTTQGLKNKKTEIAQNAIIDWIRAHALALPVSEFDEPTKIVVSGVPFPLVICRCQKTITSDDPLWILPLVEGDLRELRKNRIRRAYHDKLIKKKNLSGWKQDCDARTVLIFENIDGPIQGFVANIVIDIIKVAAERPDEIYLVSTGRDVWWVSPILVDDISLHHRNSPSEWAWQIDPQSLESLTGR